MRRSLLACLLSFPLAAADLSDAGARVLFKANQYFEILSRAPLRSDPALSIAGFQLRSVTPGTRLRLGKKWFPVGNLKNWMHYQDAPGKAWIDLVEFDTAASARSLLEKATQWHYGNRTGDSFAFVTYQREPGEDVVAAGLRRDRILLNFGIALPFPVPYDGKGAAPAPEQMQAILEDIDALAGTIEHTARAVVGPDYKTWFPPAAPTAEDIRLMRIGGFTRLWSEVKYNFVFLRERPKLDWDAMLDLYLPRIAAAKDDDEYVRLMQEATALLQDGHTRVTGDKPRAPVAVEIERIEGTPIVVAAEASTGVKPGMELLVVDDVPLGEKLTRDVYPYGAASTPQSRELTALREVLAGTPGTTVRAGFADPEGKRMTVALARGFTQFGQKPPAEFRELRDGIAVLTINSFMTDAGVKEFDANRERIRQAKGLIIDVRANGGGNSNNGDRLVARLIDGNSARLVRWKTRVYRPSFRAWGRPEEWYESNEDSIQPADGKPFPGPVAVLIGPRTASASENFIVTLAASKRATLIGSPSNGSTGQPLFFHIYGASVAICTKWDTAPDGAEFVGVGVKPDIAVERTRRDVIEGKDPVLEAAIRFLTTPPSTAPPRAPAP
jgi:carboxyl-terminal processing protease